MHEQVKISHHTPHLFNRIKLFIHHGLTTSHLVAMLLLSSSVTIHDGEEYFGSIISGIVKQETAEQTRAVVRSVPASQLEPKPQKPEQPPQITVSMDGIFLSVPYTGPNATYKLEHCVETKKRCRTFTFQSGSPR